MTVPSLCCSCDLDINSLLYILSVCVFLCLLTLYMSYINHIDLGIYQNQELMRLKNIKGL